MKDLNTSFQRINKFILGDAAPCFPDDSDLNVWSWFAYVNGYLGLLASHDIIRRSIRVGDWSLNSSGPFSHSNINFIPDLMVGLF